MVSLLEKREGLRDGEWAWCSDGEGDGLRLCPLSPHPPGSAGAVSAAAEEEEEEEEEEEGAGLAWAAPESTGVPRS